MPLFLAAWERVPGIRGWRVLLPPARLSWLHPQADKVVAGLTEMNSSILLQTKRAMRQELIHEALSRPDLETRLRELREILPASIEREVLVDAELAREVRWHSSASACGGKRNPGSVVGVFDPFQSDSVEERSGVRLDANPTPTPRPPRRRRRSGNGSA